MNLIMKMQIAIGLIACTMIASCGKEEMRINETTSAKSCKMLFNGEVNGFDGVSLKTVADTRSERTSWEDGDKVYIAFHKGTSVIAGIATFSSSEGWSVDYDGLLPVGSDLNCEVRYFVNATEQTSYTVKLNANTEIYETTEGKYSFDGETVNVSATMLPKTGRIRFSGNEGEVVYIKGITTYKTFSATNCQFYTTEQMVKRTVEEGATPYIYGYFTDESPLLYVIGSDYSYTRSCSANIFKTGESGYMDIPTEAKHPKWQKGVILSINDVDYRMLSIGGPYNHVLLGETEVTEAFYDAVSNGSSSSMFPKECSYNDWESFTKILSNHTKMELSIPKPGSWNWAIKGGNLSHGYTYSGSNDVNEVAWYSDNSGGAKHVVKQLMPNELGFYDMNGNVAEYTEYNVGYSWIDYYWRGGDYNSNKNNVEINSYRTSNSSGLFGLRPSLSCTDFVE